MFSHITAWTQGRPLLPALRNSGRFLTIPLILLFSVVFVSFIVQILRCYGVFLIRQLGINLFDVWTVTNPWNLGRFIRKSIFGSISPIFGHISICRNLIQFWYYQNGIKIVSKHFISNLYQNGTLLLYQNCIKKKKKKKESWVQFDTVWCCNFDTNLIWLVQFHTMIDEFVNFLMIFWYNLIHLFDTCTWIFMEISHIFWYSKICWYNLIHLRILIQIFTVYQIISNSSVYHQILLVYQIVSGVFVSKSSGYTKSSTGVSNCIKFFWCIKLKFFWCIKLYQILQVYQIVKLQQIVSNSSCIKFFWCIKL